MLEHQFTVTCRDEAGSVNSTLKARADFDPSLAGRPSTLNPVELRLASPAACSIKGGGRSAPMLWFQFRSVDVRLRVAREGTPPPLLWISYGLTIDADEPKRKLELPHTNVRKHGKISTTLSAAVTLTGTINREVSGSYGH